MKHGNIKDMNAQNIGKVLRADAVILSQTLFLGCMRVASHSSDGINEFVWVGNSSVEVVSLHVTGRR